MKFAKPNRDKKTKPARRRYWCNGCDAYMVWVGGKCPRCGYKEKTKHRKK